MAFRDFRTRLIRRAVNAGLFLDDGLVDRLIAYHELLARWNRKINLTGLTDADEAVDRLLLEPVLASRHLPSADVRIMDIGSGGGSPAIPLKLASPASGLLMVEAKVRKSAFLREAVRTLELTNTVVETGRYEELLLRPDLQEAFGVLSLRAIRMEPNALGALHAFIQPGGALFLFRGPSGPKVVQATHRMRWVENYPLVESSQSRLTILRKISGE